MSEEITQLLSSLHPLERKVLVAFKDRQTFWEHELIQKTGLDESRFSMALGWLLSKEILVVGEEDPATFVSLTDLGRAYASKLYPEHRIVDELHAGKSLLIQDVRNHFGLEQLEVSTAIGNLKQHGIVRVGQGGTLELLQGSWSYEATYKNLLDRLKDGQPVNVKTLSVDEQIFLEQHLEKDWKTRGVIKWSEKISKRFELTSLGSDLMQRLPTEAVGEEVSQLTPELLKDGTWRGKSFRKYNIGLKPPRVLVGKKHPYREFLDQVKTKLIAMGFEEMRGPLVETEFWNMDALYMPQFHPARDIHDVYFVKEPQFSRSIPEPYLSQVAEAHHSGWKTGSVGWRYSFDIQRARRLVLRSQGTAVSARTLAGQGNAGGPKIPGKYFSMARCFRYDQVDATHACDFFQIEGIVLGEEINFRTLLGLLQLFALEVAKAREVKFLPAYFPFTEPSVELHVRHPKLGWMELGGAGLFRPEVTRPLGVEVPVIAWGLGLDRMAMVALEISDIRDLFSTDLDLIRTKRIKP